MTKENDTWQHGIMLNLG